MKKNSNRKIFKKIKNFGSSIIYKFHSLLFVKRIFIFYLFITILGSLILYLPICQNKGLNISYIDALFTSASSFSDTGLTTLITAKTWTYFGQGIIAILILVGGIGWFSLKVYLFNILLGRPISFTTRQTLSAERGSLKQGNVKSIVKVSITILFILIILFTFILSIYFYFIKPDANPFNNHQIQKPLNMIIGENAYHNIATSFRWGLFHSISALNNAGFDIIGAHSLQPYYYKYGVQIIFIILFIIGGIGFPVIYDIYLWTRSKFTKEQFRWSLFTKISCTAYVALALIGLSMTFMFEILQNNTLHHETFWNNSHFGNKENKIMAIIFNTFSTRNAGFATIDMNYLSSPTIIVYIIMMFIGSAPSSTAGGIRTTTIAIICLGLWSKIRGKKSVTVFNRRIPKDTVSKCYIIMTTAIFIVMIISLVSLTSFESFGGSIKQGSGPILNDKGQATGEFYHSYIDLFFETSSAFGTTGLSMGITSHISLISKVLIILLMFIGQLGISSTLLVWDNKQNKLKKYELVKEDVTTG